MARVSFLLLFLILNPCLLYAKGDPAAGEIKARICTQCHSVDGVNPDPLVPILNGQNQNFLYNNGMQYTTGKRFDIVMAKVIGKVLPSEEDIADITAYYANLPLMSGRKMSDSKIMTEEALQGKGIFINRNCVFCHNDDDRKNKIYIRKTAVIGGQNKAYLYKALKDIQEGIRRADEFNLMERVLKKMTDDEISAVSEYLSEL